MLPYASGAGMSLSSLMCCSMIGWWLLGSQEREEPGLGRPFYTAETWARYQVDGALTPDQKAFLALRCKHLYSLAMCATCTFAAACATFKHTCNIGFLNHAFHVNEASCATWAMLMESSGDHLSPYLTFNNDFLKIFYLDFLKVSKKPHMVSSFSRCLVNVYSTYSIDFFVADILFLNYFYFLRS